MKKIIISSKKTEFVFFGDASKFQKAESVDFWQNKTAEERFLATVGMAQEVAEMKGINNVERFLRSVAIFKPAKS